MALRLVNQEPITERCAFLLYLLVMLADFFNSLPDLKLVYIHPIQKCIPLLPIVLRAVSGTLKQAILTPTTTAMPKLQRSHLFPHLMFDVNIN